MKIAVVGGGASGLMAAITAAGAAARVILFEGNNKPGKKILSTGNGRCNLSNTALDPSLYHGSAAKLAGLVIGEYGVKETLAFFDKIGIPCVTAASAKGDDRWVYPACREAAQVHRALEMECERLGVQIYTECRIVRVAKDRKIFRLTTEDGTVFTADRVIISTGGMAAPKTGSDGNGYGLAQDLGHSIVQPLPALGALTSDNPLCKRLGGVRAEAKVSLMIDGKVAAQESGEVQFTEYGLSGIPVFQLSGRAVQALAEGKNVALRLNLWPTRIYNELYLMLADRRVRRPTVKSGAILLGMVPDKLVGPLLEKSRIDPQAPCNTLTREELVRLDFNSCQVTAGGIPASELSANLESLLCPGLFFTGEIVDTDGPCGGYNLQWAWSSGRIAGLAAAR